MPYADPQKRAECKRRWAAANPEKRAASRKKWQQRNRERVNEYGRKHNNARRARKLGQFLEHVDRHVVYRSHGGMCGICHGFIAGDFHVDHVVPLVLGGQHGYVNVQPAHPECNLWKGHRV